MKNFCLLFAGIALLTSAIGCCCGQSGCNRPIYSGYGGGGCPGGNCGVGAAAYPSGIAPQGAYQNYNAAQASYPGAVGSPIVAGAFAQPIGVPQTAVAPLEPLPSY